MSSDVYVCKPGDDYDEVAETMAKHQVRRVPVVDDSERLLGMIAQADVVREAPSRDRAANVIEQISEPSQNQRNEPSGLGGITKSTLLLAGGLSVGAGLLYMLDPRWAKRAVEQISGGRAQDQH
jgi:predicted transcriptional regulator